MTLILPAANLGRRLFAATAEAEAEPEQRELKGWTGAGKKALNSTDYALLVSVPASSTYKSTAVSPGRFLPAAWKKPAVQSNGDLLWARVPMPLYQAKNSTRKFKARECKDERKGGAWARLVSSDCLIGCPRPRRPHARIR